MPQVKHFFDQKTSTLTYVVFDSESKDAVIIDPVWNFDQASGNLSKESLLELMEFLNTEKLNPRMILETHVHADHISSSQLLKEIFPDIKLLIGNQICTVQETFKKLYNLPESFKVDGSQFDCLVKDQEIIRAGSLEFKVLFTPGHTPACVSYQFKGKVFTGDLLFMPDSGTGRCDFPGGDASKLYHSVQTKIYSLPDSTETFTGHDYQPNGRELKFCSTVKEHKEKNIHIQRDTTEEEFVNFRTSRDKTLSAPQLLLSALQVNIRAGHLPEPESNGVSYLKIPIHI